MSYSTPTLLHGTQNITCKIFIYITDIWGGKRKTNNMNPLYRVGERLHVRVFQIHKHIRKFTPLPVNVPDTYLKLWSLNLLIIFSSIFAEEVKTHGS